MKKRATLLAALVGCSVLLVAEVSFGQATSSYNRQPYPTRYQPARPTVSPYMNLFRNGTSPALNYQTLVRPQIRQEDTNQRERAAVDRLQRQVGEVSQAVYAPSRNLRTTGHRTVFLDYSHYYSVGTPAPRR